MKLANLFSGRCFKVALVLYALGALVFAQSIPTISNSTAGLNSSFVAGKFVANYYNYSGAAVYSGNAAIGSSSITIRGGYVVLPDARTVEPFAVGVPIVISDANPELVVPTSVSGCYNAKGMNQDGILVTCTVTASFAAIHGIGAQVLSGTNGLAEAALDAFNWGGGVVVIAPGWNLTLNTNCTGCYASKNAALAALLPLPVSFEDDSQGPPSYWNLQQTASTFLAVPATLTASTVGFGINGANTTGGTYTGANTYHYCIAYVDVAGQEGACSADFSGATAGTGTTNQIGFSAPAASAGAVGYTVYISLSGGTYSLAYQAPLTSANCTLTKIETVTPACAVANTTYGQSGSAAVISALTVNTSPVGMQLAGVSGTLLTGNPNGRTTYGYVPSAHLAAPGAITIDLAFTAGGIGSATPISIGTVNLPAGFLNYIGKTIRVCGKYLNTDVNSSTQIIDFYWDAAGSNVAGSPVKLTALTETGTGTAAAYEGSFCENLITTVSGSGATAGSVLPSTAFFQYALVSTGAVVGSGQDTQAAAVASLNLAGTAGFSNRLSIIHSNATGNATPQLQSLTIEVL